MSKIDDLRQDRLMLEWGQFKERVEEVSKEAVEAYKAELKKDLDGLEEGITIDTELDE